MKIRLALVVSTFALSALGLNAANAAVILSEEFDSASNVTLNWTGDSTFVPPTAPTPGHSSVDLVGNANGFGNLAYNGGVSLDLDGTTGTGFSPAGAIQSVATLNAGNYTVSFLLAGNLRGATNKTTRVSIGDQFVDITPISNAQGYTLYTEYFTNASGKVGFMDLGAADQMGNLLDNILVSTVVSAIPEPASWAMMLTGFGAIGFAMRRKKKLTFAI